MDVNKMKESHNFTGYVKYYDQLLSIRSDMDFHIYLEVACISSKLISAQGQCTFPQGTECKPWKKEKSSSTINYKNSYILSLPELSSLKRRDMKIVYCESNIYLSSCKKVGPYSSLLQLEMI